MKRILITGGPVHCKLDAVKMITNKFKGGRMAEMAHIMHERGRKLAKDNEDRTDPSTSFMNHYLDVTYLCAKGSVLPKCSEVVSTMDLNSQEEILPWNAVRVIYHDGFHDYREKVKQLAPHMDAVILGAAVCNLIPANPWEGKFPSHNYKVGDVISINFTIAPRIVDEVKKYMKKDAHLFAFKLLKGVSHEELVEAAYDIVLESGATCVFANDAIDLDTKFAITKEHSDIKLDGNEYINFIEDRMSDEYYSTVISEDRGSPAQDDINKTRKLLSNWEKSFKKTYGKENYIFGTVAVRVGQDWRNPSFITTARGKKDLRELVYVKDVDHKNRTVVVAQNGNSSKASLNAPLLHHIFEQWPDVKEIVHYHGSGKDFKDVPVYPYATPGTVRDSFREVPYMFEIENHGMFICFE